MFLATCDFQAVYAATSVIPAMVAAIWALFLVAPVGLVLGVRAGQLVIARKPAVKVEIRVARNGRLYAVVGQCPVWSRRGESASDLAIRVLASV